MKSAFTVKAQNYETNKIAEDLRRTLGPLASNPFLNGQVLENISLSASTTNVIEHKLDRPLRFWTIVRGPIVNSNQTISDVRLTSYTPTVTAATGSVTNCTTIASYTVTNGWINLLFKMTFSAASAAFNWPRLSLPSGFTLDLTYLQSPDGWANYGSGVTNDTGTNTFLLGVLVPSSTQVSPFVINTASTYAGPNHIQNTVPFTYNTGDTLNFKTSLPLSGRPIKPDIWEVTGEFNEKYLYLKTTTDCTVSLYVG